MPATPPDGCHSYIYLPNPNPALEACTPGSQCSACLGMEKAARQVYTATCGRTCAAGTTQAASFFFD